jgi:dihydropteroate synthase
LNDAPGDERIAGSLATAMIAVWKGANILRVHDVKETVDSVRVISAIRDQL